MANYNKPGVYIEESLLTNAPINAQPTQSIAAFVGYSDHGPTSSATIGSVSYTGVGIPTLVTGWGDFVKKFSFGSASNVFSSVKPIYLTTSGTVTTSATSISVATAGITVGSVVSVASGTGAFADKTVVTAVGTGTVTISTPPTTLVASAATLAITPNTDLKYAVKSFFDNGGSQAYILRDGAVKGSTASLAIRDQGYSLVDLTSGTNVASTTYTTTATTPAGAYTANTDLTISSNPKVVVGMTAAVTSGTGALTATAVVTKVVSATVVQLSTGTSTSFGAGDTITFTLPTNSLILTSSVATTYANLTAGQVVTISGVTDSGATAINGNWVVSGAGAGGAVRLFYTSTAVSSVTVTTGSVVLSKTNSATNAFTVSANGTGIWGNNIWLTITPSSVANYFDINLYISSATTAAAALATDVVETWGQLSMDSGNSRYFINLINSAYITVTDGGSPNTGYNRLPVFNGTWASAQVNGANPANTTSTGSFLWSVAASGFTASGAIDVGMTASNTQIASSPAPVAGTEGDTARSSVTGLTDAMVGRFDVSTSPLLINWAANSSSDVTNLLNYAATRGDSFVVIDAPNTTVANTLSVVNGFTSNQKFGAAYYPYITIPQPYTSAGQTATIAPGGAVVGTYVKTDQTRGVFKAPAGAKDANLANVVSIASLSSSDFDVINNNTGANLNIIRYVPGNGICIMGARTLATDYTTRYVPVRRTLNYLSSNLRTITQFAVFEPNDPNLWVRVSTVVNTFLNDFWRTGGLYGATADQAFYVKCDSTINTNTSVSAGELHVEIGVALLKPAEFIVIRIGQIDSGTTVTVTV